MAERRTIAGAFDKIESHEALCAERYESIHEKLADLKGTMNKAVWGAITVLISLVGWMGVQLWDGAHAPAKAAVPAVSQ